MSSPNILTTESASPDVLKLKESLQRAYRTGGADVLIAHIAALTDTIQRLTSNGPNSVTDLTDRIIAMELAMKATTTMPAASPDMYQQKLTILAGMALSEEHGLHKLEYTKGGLPFRWTGPARTTGLVCYVQRDEPKTATVNICNFSLREDIEITALVDGQRLVWKSIEKQEGVSAHSIDLPQRDKDLPTLIGVEVSRVWGPKDTNPDSKDERLLGVAFHSLLIG